MTPLAFEEAIGIVGTAYSDEEAKVLFSKWEERAKAFPGARLGMKRVPDPIGGASFWIFTDSIGLCKLLKWPSIDELRARNTSPEDAEALRVVEQILRGEKVDPGMDL